MTETEEKTLEANAFDELDEIAEEANRALRAFNQDDAVTLHDALVKIKSTSTAGLRKQRPWVTPPKTASERIVGECERCRAETVVYLIPPWASPEVGYDRLCRSCQLAELPESWEVGP